MRPSGYRQPSNWKQLKATVLERDAYRCYLCSGPATTVDHVIPVAQGGTHKLTNLAAICVPCHTAKTKAEAAQGLATWRVRHGRQRERESHPNR